MMQIEGESDEQAMQDSLRDELLIKTISRNPP